MKKNSITEIISFLLIIIFVYTAASKLIYYNDALHTLLSSPLNPVARIILVFLPLTELTVASLLLTPKMREWGLYGSFTLMSIFTLYVAFILFFAEKVPCTCGGIIQKMSWRQHLSFNISFTALSLLAIKINKGKKNFPITAPKKELFP